MQNSHMMHKDEVALVVDGDGPLKYLTEESSEIETENTKEFAWKLKENIIITPYINNLTLGIACNTVQLHYAGFWGGDHYRSRTIYGENEHLKNEIVKK